MLIIPSLLATYNCKLYFSTNKGLAEADSTSHSVDNEALATIQNKNGPYLSFQLLWHVPRALSMMKTSHGPSLMRLSTTTCSKPWERTDGTNSALTCICTSGWPSSSHEWKIGSDEVSRRALLVYHVSSMCPSSLSWHTRLVQSLKFNLCHLNSELLSSIRNEMAHKAA